MSHAVALKSSAPTPLKNVCIDARIQKTGSEIGVVEVVATVEQPGY